MNGMIPEGWLYLAVAALLGSELAWWMWSFRTRRQLAEAWGVARGSLKMLGTAQDCWGLLLEIHEARCRGWTTTESVLTAEYNACVERARAADEHGACVRPRAERAEQGQGL